MSKLREKFEMYIDLYKEEYLAEQCEQITDDFSVKFAEWSFWLKRREFEGEKQFYFENKPYTTTELQQYFKQNIYEKE